MDNNENNLNNENIENLDENPIYETIVENKDAESKNDFEEQTMRPIEEKFYTETITPKKKKMFTKKAVALLMVFTLVLGSGLGYGLGTTLGNTLGHGGTLASAANNVITISNPDGTTWPVVAISKKVSPAIVAIKVTSNARDFFGAVYESGGTGSGIIIDNQGHIVTNNHVVEGAKSITVLLNDGKELDAKLVGRDALTDLAVIQVSEKNLPYVEFGDSTKLQVGELAVAIGSPMGTDYAGSVTSGIISGLDRKVSLGDRSMKLIQTDAAINPGNSGGALVNSQGQVIGINTLKLIEDKVEGMGFAIPINEAKPIITQLIEKKTVVRPQLGISGSTVTKEMSDQYKVPMGVVIQEVAAGSGADKAGLKKGDIITAIDGTKVLTIDEVREIIGRYKINDVLKVTAYNELGRSVTVNVTLAASAVQ